MTSEEADRRPASAGRFAGDQFQQFATCRLCRYSSGMDDQQIRALQRDLNFRAHRLDGGFMPWRQRVSEVERLAGQRRRTADYRDRLDRARIAETDTVARALVAVMLTEPGLAVQSNRLVGRAFELLNDAGYDIEQTMDRLTRLARKYRAVRGVNIERRT